VPFGAVTVTMFFWRRLTRLAVWWCVVLSIAALIVAPFFIQYVPAVGRNSNLAIFTEPTSPTIKPAPVFFETVVRENLADLSSPLIGRGRFNIEAWAISCLGFDLRSLTTNDLLAVQFYIDGLFPFLVLILVSLGTRPPETARIDQFFGRMKTPVGATPELEEAAMEETRRNPHRFDHTKVFPRSAWEFTHWDRVDTIGFFVCCAVSAGIIAFFWFLLRVVAA